jgi:hypothetical protein
MTFNHDIAAEISSTMMAAEEANEKSMMAICDLLSVTLAKRRAAGVSPAVAQPAVLRLKRALDQAIESHNNVLRFHGDMSDHYKVLAADDIIPFTENHLQRSAEQATKSSMIVPLRA